MESTYTDLALYGDKNVCARTDNGFYPISEVCSGTVSPLKKVKDMANSIVYSPKM